MATGERMRFDPVISPRGNGNVRDSSEYRTNDRIRVPFAVVF